VAHGVISEIGFEAPLGFIEQGKDVEGLIQGFHGGLPAFGLLARLHPFTRWVKATFLKKYLVAKLEDNTGIGVLMRFRDRLIDQRLREVAEGKDVAVLIFSRRLSMRAQMTANLWTLDISTQRSYSSCSPALIPLGRCFSLSSATCSCKTKHTSV
jgi:hypothetical protein